MHATNVNTELSEKPIEAKNPHFSHINRAPYELGYLLRGLPPHVSSYEEQSSETYLKAEAAGKHASNGINALLNGVEAIGALMVHAGTNEEYEVSRSTVMDLGSLVGHIAVELQFLLEVESSMELVVRSREQFLSKKGKQNGR